MTASSFFHCSYIATGFHTYRRLFYQCAFTR